MRIVFLRVVALWFCGPLFIKRTDVLPQDVVKSGSCEVGCCTDHIALKRDRHLGNAAAEVSVKFQGDRKCLNPNLAASRLHESYGKTSVSLVNRGHEFQVDSCDLFTYIRQQ